MKFENTDNLEIKDSSLQIIYVGYPQNTPGYYFIGTFEKEKTDPIKSTLDKMAETIFADENGYINYIGNYVFGSPVGQNTDKLVLGVQLFPPINEFTWDEMVAQIRLIMIYEQIEMDY